MAVSYAGLQILANSQSLVVSTTGSWFTDTGLSAAVTFPLAITADTTIYTGNEGVYTISVKQPDGSEIYGVAIHLYLNTVTPIAPLPTSAQVAADIARSFAQGTLQSGNYYFTQGTLTTATISSGSESQLRVSPWYVPNACTLSRIGAEVTGAGEAGSKLRLGVYADNGVGKPGALVVDGGQIAGDSTTVQELTISVALTPGLYWIGAAPQSCPTTRPTVRAAGTAATIGNLLASPTIPLAGDYWVGWSVSSVSGALPATFGTPSLVGTTSIIRTFVKVA